MSKQLVNLDFVNTAKGINHPLPINPGDLVNKAYVDSNGHYIFSVVTDGVNQPNQALQRDGCPSNQCPFTVPYDSELFAVTCGDRDNNINATWELQIEINDILATSLTLVKSAGQAEASLEVANPVQVNARDRVSLWMRNQSERIRDPRGSVHGRKRR